MHPDRGRAAEGDAARSRGIGGEDVQVVANLGVVAEEADGDDDYGLLGCPGEEGWGGENSNFPWISSLIYKFIRKSLWKSLSHFCAISLFNHY